MPAATTTGQKLQLLSPWRRSFQWITTLLILLLPWLQPGGNSLLRLDIPSLSLYLFGQVLRIEELFLFLLFCLAFGTGFLLTTLVSGRVWCGWACPQTTLNDLAEWLAKWLGLKVSNNHLYGDLWRKGVAQLFYLFLAALLSANLIWYFIEPQRFFRDLLTGQLHVAIWVTFGTITTLVYLDLALVRRLMCKELCPYGRIQTALIDPATLTLQLPDSEADRCIRCNRCVRICPMEIDIRNGYQIECINCGRCLDACRQVMAKRQQSGLIKYTFGVDSKSATALFNPRTVLLGTLLVILTMLLTVSIFNRAPASLKVAVSHSVSSKILKDGQQATFFQAWINNRSTATGVYRVQAQSDTGAELTLKGQTEQLQLAAGGNRKIEYVLLSSPAAQPFMINFILTNQQDRQVATAEAQISPIAD